MSTTASSLSRSRRARCQPSSAAPGCRSSWYLHYREGGWRRLIVNRNRRSFPRTSGQGQLPAACVQPSYGDVDPPDQSVLEFSCSRRLVVKVLPVSSEVIVCS